jgi:abortive infection bacteriophage resistance protein
MKPFNTYEEMVAKLRDRNMIVGTSAVSVLRRENYYNLINGYKGFFLDAESPFERYRDGVSFDDLYELSCLDRELRFAFFKQILQIESTLKSIISYRTGEFFKGDQEFYLRGTTYSDSPKVA